MKQDIGGRKLSQILKEDYASTGDWELPPSPAPAADPLKVDDTGSDPLLLCAIAQKHNQLVDAVRRLELLRLEPLRSTGTLLSLIGTEIRIIETRPGEVEIITTGPGLRVSVACNGDLLTTVIPQSQ